MNFVKLALENGGDIKPLLFNNYSLDGPALTNPTVIVSNGEILINIRNVNYTLYHSELDKFEHVWGPLIYVHPENDIKLRTTNHIIKMNEKMETFFHSKIDTSAHDVYEPQWDFVGLEDGRLVSWEDKVYLIGVRRDLDNVGTGRMEVSELEFSNNSVKEILRYRIPGPPPDDEYCMKNCTPIEDKPFHLLKWTNPTTLLKFDILEKKTEIKQVSEYIPMSKDMRGGSQVIRYKDGYLTIVHEQDFYFSEQARKNATYKHRFVYWDSEFKNQKFSKLFSFLNMKIEFCCGLAKYDKSFLITFGGQDNTAYILKITEDFLDQFLSFT